MCKNPNTPFPISPYLLHIPTHFPTHSASLHKPSHTTLYPPHLSIPSPTPPMPLPTSSPHPNTLSHAHPTFLYTLQKCGVNDDYLSLVESGKQQIKEVRRKFNRKTWKQRQLLRESEIILHIAPPSLSRDRSIKMKKSIKWDF